MLAILEKKNRLKLMILLGGALVLIGSAIALPLILLSSGNGTNAWAFDSYRDSFDNSKPNYISEDSAITFDGILDDTAWQNQRWLEVAQANNETVRVKMTAYFGHDGLYMAFDVRDVGVFSAKKRAPALNSGIQLYVSPMSGADNIEGLGYEIMLTAGGVVQVNKFLNGGYTTVSENVYLAVKLDGELNSLECKGYTMEAFLPYEMIGDGEQSFYASPAIVRTSSDQGEERQWYWFGEELKGSLWTAASTWWSFDKGGLVAHSVTLTDEDGGKLAGDAFVTDDSDYTFWILPTEEYYATSVIVNGAEIADRLLYKNGQAYYIVENVSGDLDIKAAFAKVPAQTVNVSGKVTDGKNAINGAAAWVIKNGYAQPIILGANGAYTVEAPALDGMRIYAEATGYVPAYTSVKTGGGNVDVTLKKNYLGDNGNVSHPITAIGQWDFTRLHENRVRLKVKSGSATLMNTAIYSNSVYASANVTLPEQKGIDARAGFIFCDAAGRSVFVALTMNGEVSEWNPEGRVFYTLQIISADGEAISWNYGGVLAAFNNPDAVKSKANSAAGIALAAHYHDGVIDVWVDGEKVGYSLAPTNKDGNPLFAAETKMGVGLHSWLNRTIYTNLTFDGNRAVDTAQTTPGWDLSGLAQGTAKCLVPEFMIKAPLKTAYGDKISLSANIQLPQEADKDTRAGFYFVNKRGDEVFVALTMDGEKKEWNPEGRMYYTIQFINQQKGKDLLWSYGGVITDISGWIDVKDAACSSTGVPVTVYIENGRFTVGVNGHLVADGVYPTDANGKNIFDGDMAVAVGLESALRKTVFTNIKLGDAKPTLTARASDGWDISQLDQGKVSLTKPLESSMILWPAYKSRSYVSVNIPLKPEGKDVRAGIRFIDETGNIVFVSLLNDASGRYSVQVICLPVDGSWGWSHVMMDINKRADVRAAANSDSGLPLAASFNNGKLNIWVNGIQIADGIAPNIDGKNVFASGAKVAAGLECWSVACNFSGIVAADSRP